MHIPFDTTPKALADAYPAEWPRLLGWPSEPVEVIDADVATVSGAADKVFRIGSRNPWLMLLEFLTSYKFFIPERLHWHTTLIAHRHDLLVRSILILLRPEAGGTTITGKYEIGFPDEEPYVTFRYRVVRLWEIPSETLLAGGVGLAAFAPIGKLDPAELLGTVHKARLRIEAECPEQDAKELLACMYILMGMRYDEHVIEKIKKEVPTMEESITYQEIVKKGETKGRLADARELVQLLGTDRWGAPAETTIQTLNSITDINRLQQMCRRVNRVNSWEELLGGA